MKRFAGLVLIALVLAGLFGGTVWAHGWTVAWVAWVGAVAVAAVLGVAMGWLYGEYSGTLDATLK